MKTFPIFVCQKSSFLWWYFPLAELGIFPLFVFLCFGFLCHNLYFELFLIISLLLSRPQTGSDFVKLECDQLI